MFGHLGARLSHKLMLAGYFNCAKPNDTFGWSLTFHERHEDDSGRDSEGRRRFPFSTISRAIAARRGI